MKRFSKDTLKAVRALLVTTVLPLLCLLVAACSGDSGHKNALAVRDYMMTALKSDTAHYSRTVLARLDTITVESDMKAELMYDIVSDAMDGYMHDGRNLETVKMLRGILNILENNPDLSREDTQQLLATYVCIGAAYEELGMTSIGLDYYMRGLEVATDSVYAPFRAMYYNNIGVLYYEANMFKEAEKQFSDALKINQHLGRREETYINYINLADVYRQNSQTDKALDAALRSLQYVDARQNPRYFYSTHILLGALYSERGDTKMAASYLENARKQLESINFVVGMLDAYQESSRAYLRRQMPDSASLYADKALNLSRKAGMQPYINTTLDVLAEAREAEGEWQQASLIRRHSAQLNDSLRQAESQLRLQDWQALNELEDSTRPQPQFGVWPVVACIMLVVIVLVMVFIIFQRRQKEAELERRLRDQVHESGRELDLRNREMTTMTLERIHTQEGLQSVCEELKGVLLELNPKETAKRNRIRQLLGQLETLAGDSDSTDEFRQYFEKVHPDFYRALRETCPDLTARDLRLCAFLYLGLSTKEIATMTYREVRSVESSRARLRKKLGLDVNADLSAYLLTLAPR